LAQGVGDAIAAYLVCRSSISPSDHVFHPFADIPHGSRSPDRIHNTDGQPLAYICSRGSEAEARRAMMLTKDVAAGPREDAGAAYKKGDYATALRLIRPLAEKGDADAQVNLGVMYANGRGVPQDYAAAVSWYRKAAAQGDAQGQTELGLMYHLGRGVPQDYAAAVSWYGKAAEQGVASAQFLLGSMYSQGQGVRRDNAAAVSWFRKAADQGFAEAQYNLRAMYANGLGVPQDFVTAHMWANLAAASGNKDAVKDRDIAASRMTPAQIAAEAGPRVEAKMTTGGITGMGMNHTFKAAVAALMLAVSFAGSVTAGRLRIPLPLPPT
jgi:uncharacterized protein